MSTKIVEPVRARRCLLPVYVFPPGSQSQGITLAGLVDTGAVHSAIDPRLAAVMGLPIAGMHTVSSAGGPGAVVPAYRAVVDIWQQGFGLAGRGFQVELSTLIAPMVGGTLLIGMDILQHGQYGLRESGIWDFTY